MKVKKKDFISGQGATQKTLLTRDGQTDGQNVQRQTSMADETLNLTFEDMMNDPQFFSMMPTAFPPYDAYSGAQYPNTQYPNTQFPGMQNPYFMNMLIDDDDDDDDDDEEDFSYLMPMNSQQPGQTNKFPLMQPKSALNKENVKPTTSKLADVSASSSVTQSPVSQDLNISASNSPISFSKETFVAGRPTLKQTVVSDVSLAGVQAIGGQDQNITGMHSYSLPTPASNVTAPLSQSGQGIYIDFSGIVNKTMALPEVEFAENQNIVPISPVMTSQSMEITQPMDITIQTSPDTVNFITSPLPSTISMAEKTPRSKSIKSSATKSKAKSTTISSSTSTRRRKSPKPSASEQILVTPVETISNIVGTKVDEDEFYKEVINKPIRHNIEILDMDKTHNRSVKNAINARVNRQKHKQFVQTLEEENGELKDRIVQLESLTDKLTTEKDVLQQEIRYLKSVIANETTIAKVLNGLSDIKDVNLSSGFAKLHRKRAADSTVSDNGESKRSSHNNDVTAGVCLHVHDQSVSVELCEQCASMAASGRP